MAKVLMYCVVLYSDIKSWKHVIDTTIYVHICVDCFW